MPILRLFFCILSFSFILMGCKQEPALADLNGHSISLKETHSKWVVINYWSSLCDTCIAEIPELNAFYNIHHNNVLLFSFDYDQESLDKLKVVTTKLGLHYPTLTIDPAAQFGLPAIKGVPTTFLISPQGEIQPAIEGGVTHKLLDEKMKITDTISAPSNNR